MAAAVRALNSRIRANPYLDYFCSTHFWGPASNFGIPLAAVMDTQKDPEIISGRMTVALSGYSAVFMRYSMMVTPKNYLLFGCHFVNFSAQVTQLYRYVNWWHFGGRDSAHGAQAAAGSSSAGVLEDAKGKAEELASKAKDSVQSVTGGKK